jgi:aldehyde dehydrogenase (NAD+)
VLAAIAEGDKEDIDRAVAAARAAFEGPWSKWKPYERRALLLKIGDLIEKYYDELSMLDTLDMGAPISRTRGTRQRVLGMLCWYAGMATSIHGETIENSLPGEYFSYTLKEPVGVVGAIIPWDGPLGACIWKIGPALATGCKVILKPAEEAPLTALRLGELLLGPGGAVRRLQDERLRARIRHPANGRILERQSGLDQDRLRQPGAIESGASASLSFI